MRELRYAWPTTPQHQLAGPPLLESWDGKQHPSQIRLVAYVDDHRALLATDLAANEGEPLAMALAVGRPPSANLFATGDLDNHLTPVARAVAGAPVVSFWAAKRHAAASTIAIGRATRVEATERPWIRAEMNASAQSAAYKQELADQVGVHDAAMSNDPVELEICFRVGSHRNWVSLWKPTIDALGGLLGVPDAARPWHPNDGRIVRLGLHLLPDESIGHRVFVTLWAKVRGRAPEPAGDHRQKDGPDRQPALEAPTTRAPGTPVTGTTVFIDDESGYIRWLAEHAGGFVVNAQRSPRSALPVLHRATCRTIRDTPPRGSTWTSPYLKVCSHAIPRLEQWCREHAGREPKRCGSCDPS
jgi:hypothetical protein